MIEFKCLHLYPCHKASVENLRNYASQYFPYFPDPTTHITTKSTDKTQNKNKNHTYFHCVIIFRMAQELTKPTCGTSYTFNNGKSDKV